MGEKFRRFMTEAASVLGIILLTVGMLSLLYFFLLAVANGWEI